MKCNVSTLKQSVYAFENENIQKAFHPKNPEMQYEKYFLSDFSLLEFSKIMKISLSSQNREKLGQVTKNKFWH